MTADRPVLPYGTWPSPISALDLTKAGGRIGDLTTDGDLVMWTQTDPGTGQSRLWRWTPDGDARQIGGDLDVRSRVHEYGGGAIWAGHRRTVVVEFGTQDLHEVHADGSTAQLTDQGLDVRWAAGVFVDADRVVAVRETHDPQDDRAPTVINELVLVDLRSGDQHVLVTGVDFVGDPSVGPDGLLAWTTWNHPSMPWDTVALWAGRVDGTELVDLTPVVDLPEVSVADCLFTDGALLWSDDRSGFWQVHRAPVTDLSAGAPVTATGLDMGGARFVFGLHWLAAAPSGTGAVTAALGTEHAATSLGLLDPDAPGGWRAVTTGVDVDGVAAIDAGIVTVENSADGARAIRLRAVGAGELHDAQLLHELPAPTSRPDDMGEIVQVTAEVDQDVTHAFVHLPANADVQGPADEAPPMVVFLHGGPTSHTRPVRYAAHAFWTTRGFAVVDVNYRGSTGHGRAYRELLRGQWGVADVADCIAIAHEVAKRGLADGDRMAIRGGSAGGFTTLAVLATADQPFACGTSFFGVADLAALAAHTHKFEARYLDGLVGPWPEARDVYAARSPLTHAHRMRAPLLVLQGSDDKVVPPAQADAMVELLVEHQVPHAHIEYAGEGHGFRKPESVVSWHQTELAFYGQVMGFAPDGDLPPVELAGGTTSST